MSHQVLLTTRHLWPKGSPSHSTQTPYLAKRLESGKGWHKPGREDREGEGEGQAVGGVYKSWEKVMCPHTNLSWGQNTSWASETQNFSGFA